MVDTGGVEPHILGASETCSRYITDPCWHRPFCKNDAVTPSTPWRTRKESPPLFHRWKRGGMRPAINARRGAFGCRHSTCEKATYFRVGSFDFKWSKPPVAGGKVFIVLLHAASSAHPPSEALKFDATGASNRELDGSGSDRREARLRSPALPFH